ncbi:glycosyltransferase family 87 protein [Microbacterium karelineae]|uniref:glycosyltransferase family 87 protein n=1 Tax=Microbacterium karelineae TaxID=2654283 RepID=UPI001E2EBD59|nr:glycosyltransferase family 87 protein [Microbacterium karelineae]
MTAVRPARRSIAPVVAVWAAFLLAHGSSTALGWVWPNQPMGDTYLVYEPWSDLALSGQAIMGVTDAWVYPPLALAPMVMARALVWFSSYSLAWAVLVTALDVVAFALLVRRGSSRGRLAAAWFWAAFVLALGPIALFRLDAVTVPIAVVGLLLAGAHPRIAGALVGAATWIKVWPAALVAALVISLRSRGHVIVGGAVCSAVIVGVVALAGGTEHLLGFVTTQGERGLQIEAVAATPFMFGLGGAEVYYDQVMLTYQLTGAGVDATAAALGPIMAACVAAICALGVWRVRRGSPRTRILPPLALALVVALIVCNKVGSPQFLTWLIAPLVAWIVWDRARAWGPALLALATALLTHIVYPVVYDQILMTDTVAITVLALRGALVVALGIWAVVRLARTPTPAREQVMRDRT